MSGLDSTPVVLSSAVQAVLSAAAEQAARRRHRHTTVEHLLHGLLREASVSRILGSCGCDVARLLTELAEYLDLLPELPQGSKKGQTPDASYVNVLKRSALRAIISGKDKLEPSDLLVQVFAEDDEYAGMLLGSEGLTRLELLRCISHGTPKPEVLPAHQTESEAGLPPHTFVLVVFHNDDYTPMDFVVEVLHEVFHCSETDAFELMMQIHRQGCATVGRYPFELARARVEEVLLRATLREFPLHCTLEVKR